jgi:hypothetical protein
MSFLDNVGKYADKAGKTIVKTAGNAKESAKIAMDKAKLKRQINAEQGNISKDLMDIGRIVLKKYGTNPPEEFAPYITSIKSSERNIAVLNDKIAELDSATTCAQCGNKLKKGQTFCQVCGNRTQNETPDEKPEVTIVNPKRVEVI